MFLFLEAWSDILNLDNTERFFEFDFEVFTEVGVIKDVPLLCQTCVCILYIFFFILRIHFICPSFRIMDTYYIRML